MHLFFLDFETTGLNPYQSEIVEVAPKIYPILSVHTPPIFSCKKSTDKNKAISDGTNP